MTVAVDLARIWVTMPRPFLSFLSFLPLFSRVRGRLILRSSLPQGCSSQIHRRSLGYRQGRSIPRAPPAPFPGCSLVPLGLPFLHAVFSRVHGRLILGTSPKRSSEKFAAYRSP